MTAIACSLAFWGGLLMILGLNTASAVILVWALLIALWGALGDG